MRFLFFSRSISYERFFLLIINIFTLLLITINKKKTLLIDINTFFNLVCSYFLRFLR